MKSFLGLMAIATSFFAGALAAIKGPVEVKGNAFFVGDERFYIRGVDYQPGGQAKLTDPLADYDICSRDIPYFKQLGVNTVRIYTVDNSKDHSKCMKLLADNGIYLILDVNTPKLSLNREYPADTYNDVYLQHVFATMDVLGQYENTLGFFAANEVLNDEKVHAAPYVKAIIRDMKAYVKKHLKRTIPVGYSAADVASNRMQMAHYLNCGEDDVRADFYGVNDYSWCGASSFTISGYNEKVQNFTDYSIPLFFSEYGCNTVGDAREFSEVKAIYSTQMTGVFSGGLVYEYSQEENDFGLVEIKGDKVEKLPDFDNLKAQFSAVKNPSGDGGYKKDGKASECPPKSKDWDFKNFDKVPAMPSSAKALLEDGAGKPKGIKHTNMFFGKDGKPLNPVKEDDATSGTNGTESKSKPSAGTGSRSEMALGGFYMSAAAIVVSMMAGGAFML